MTRVLHILCDLSPGGAERLVLEMCRRAPTDLQLEVATVHDGGPLHASFAQAGVRVRSAARTRGRPGARAVARLARWSRSFDVVHTHLWAGDAWGRLGGWLARGPKLVSTEHNIDRDEEWWKDRWKVATSRYTEVVAVSESVAAYWGERGVQRVRTIPNGIDLTRFTAQHVGGDGVLFAGRITRQKGVDLLLEAARHLPNRTFQIAGDGPDRAALEARAPSNVRFLGRVEDIPERLARADILAIPSRWEGFGLIAAEGLAAGVPVVAARVDGLVDVVGEHGVLFEPADAAALTAAIEHAYTRLDAPPRPDHADLARFDIETMCSRYWELYRQLTAGRTRS